MSFQAYLDTVRTQTGKTVADFRVLAEEKSLSKHGEVVKWLKNDFALGHGHATAVAAALLKAEHAVRPQDAKIGALFSGRKAVWRPIYDALWQAVQGFGDDLETDPNTVYVSLIRGPKRGKVAIVQPGAAHLHIGIKRKGIDPTERFRAAGNWNAMVTHRVRMTQAAQIDAELMDWLRAAYQSA